MSLQPQMLLQPCTGLSFHETTTMQGHACRWQEQISNLMSLSCKRRPTIGHCLHWAFSSSRCKCTGTLPLRPHVSTRHVKPGFQVFHPRSAAIFQEDCMRQVEDEERKRKTPTGSSANPPPRKYRVVYTSPSGQRFMSEKLYDRK